MEEAGIVAKKWKKVGINYGINGATKHLSHVFVASELSETGDNKQKEEGINQIKWVSFGKVLRMISEGKITDGETISALLIAGLKLKLITSK